VLEDQGFRFMLHNSLSKQASWASPIGSTNAKSCPSPIPIDRPSRDEQRKG
jgi:hypothetical protein